MNDFGARLQERLKLAEDRNRQVLENNRRIREKLNTSLPVLTKNLRGNEIVLGAIREIYNSLEKDGEELQTALVELKQARDALDIAANQLNEANYDLANIQTFSRDEIWLGEDLPTIRRALDIFNLPKLGQALTEIELERFNELDRVFKQAKRRRHAK